MTSTHAMSGRRDRRKAKASGWARGGTTNPKRISHHVYENPLAKGRLPSKKKDTNRVDRRRVLREQSAEPLTWQPFKALLSSPKSGPIQ